MVVLFRQSLRSSTRDHRFSGDRFRLVRIGGTPSISRRADVADLSLANRRRCQFARFRGGCELPELPGNVQEESAK